MEVFSKNMTCLEQLEELEREGFDLWNGEVAVRQQDILEDWQREYKEQLLALAEEWHYENQVVLKEIIGELDACWQGEVANRYIEDLRKLEGFSSTTWRRLSVGIEAFGETVEKNV